MMRCYQASGDICLIYPQPAWQPRSRMFQESVLSQGRQSKRRGNSEQMKQHGLPGPKGEKGEAGMPGDHGRTGNPGQKVTDILL